MTGNSDQKPCFLRLVQTTTFFADEFPIQVYWESNVKYSWILIRELKPISMTRTVEVKRQHKRCFHFGLVSLHTGVP